LPFLLFAGTTVVTPFTGLVQTSHEPKHLLHPSMPSSIHSLRNFAAEQRKPAKKKLASALFLAVVLQISIIVLTVFVVVFVPTTREDPQFVSQKTIYLPQRELQHQMAVSEFQQAAPSPMVMDKIQVDQMTPTSLPNLPEMPQMDFTPIAPNQSSPFGSALFANAGIGGMMEGLVGNASTISFLGIEDTARQVIFVVDISVTVKNSVEAAGLSMEQIRDELIELIQNLNANTLFGIIQHSRNFNVFQEYLVPASIENKEKAIQWLRREFRTSGSGRGWDRYEGRNGIEAVLEVAFNMSPDVIFLLSDGSYWRSEPVNQPVPYDEIHRLIQRRQNNLAEPTRIHTIGFGVRDENRRNFPSLARRNEGDHRSFD